MMEITIIKQVFLTEEIPDDLDYIDLKVKVCEIIREHDDVDEWEETDYRGKEVYEVYDTYSGCTLLNLEFKEGEL